MTQAHILDVFVDAYGQFGGGVGVIIDEHASIFAGQPLVGAAWMLSNSIYYRA